MSTSSASNPVRFTPPDLCEKDGETPLPGAPRYLIEPPTYKSRARCWQAVSDLGARQVTFAELAAVMKRGLAELVEEGPEPDQRAALTGFVDAFAAAWSQVETLTGEVRERIAALDEAERARLAELSEEERAALTEPTELVEALKAAEALSPRFDDLEAQMRRAYPPYARKLSEQQYWMEVAPIVAAQLFLVGVEGGEVAVRRVRGQVSEETLAALPEGHAQAIGWRAIRLMNMVGRDRKN